MWLFATNSEIRNFVGEYLNTKIRLPQSNRIIFLFKRDEDQSKNGVPQKRRCMQPDEKAQAKRRHMAGEIIRSSDIVLLCCPPAIGQTSHGHRRVPASKDKS